MWLKYFWKPNNTILVNTCFYLLLLVQKLFNCIVIFTHWAIQKIKNNFDEKF